MKQQYNLYDWLVFIIGITVCLILLINIISIVVLKIPTTADNLPIRSKLADILNGLIGSLLTIVGAKLNSIVNK